MPPIVIPLPRFLVRDFEEGDRPAFISYQMDPRYLRLYDLDPSDVDRAERLFDLFIEWQHEQSRTNHQLGIFDSSTGALCGCAGLRGSNADATILGIELAPDQWGRFRLALDVAAALVDYGFGVLNAATIVGSTASGNMRVEKLARRFGAEIIARREGPAWMQARGWQEVDWALSRDRWMQAQ